MEAIHRERLEKLAKLHDMQKPEALDMSRYFHDLRCESPACSLGCAQHFFPEWGLDCMETRLDQNPFYQAAEVFGITLAASMHLFDTTPRTPTEQAAAIREVIALDGRAPGELR